MLHETGHGLIEYRLAKTPHFALECRELRPGGKPYDSRWYPVPHRDFCRLQEQSDIVELLREKYAAISDAESY